MGDGKRSLTEPAVGVDAHRPDLMLVGIEPKSTNRRRQDGS
jgi:hypothetical protein